MIAFEDCVALCGLTQEEIAAIAEHEHMPEVAATALASYLLHRAHGSEAIRNMIVDDIRKALDEQRIEHATTLFAALRHYLSTHADVRAVPTDC
jgi:hypothetical protein